MNARETLIADYVLSEAIAEGIVQSVKQLPVIDYSGRWYLIEVTAIELSDM